jgi:hypothetical protein
MYWVWGDIVKAHAVMYGHAEFAMVCSEMLCVGLDVYLGKHCAYSHRVVPHVRAKQTVRLKCNVQGYISSKQSGRSDWPASSLTL